MEEYVGKVVIVTGAGGGIGSVIARTFARAGACLAICDIRADALARTENELKPLTPNLLSSVVDVSSEEEVRDFLSDISRRLGDCHVLVNTVGLVDNLGDVEELMLSEWDKTIAVNLTSAFLMAKVAVPQMKRNGGGAIVNLASVSGLANQPAAMVYSVTKAALISLTKSEAIDLAPYHIRANAISPGSVDTPMLDEATELVGKASGLTASEQRQRWAEQYPTQRFSSAEEIAELACFLCSDRASNITGANVVIDGGLTSVLPER
ncbi:MAG: short-chain dehydrogenase [Planctomycetaceae bacterium]|nr:short-chain dehydrogenase [Planctomycetaceae bacterium]